MGRVSKMPEIEKVMGKDEDLKTPVHDAIIMWLNKAIDIYFAKWVSVKKNWDEIDFKFEHGFNKSQINLDSLPEKPNLKLISKTIEYPITRGSSNILVAVPDMRVYYQTPYLFFYVSGEISIDYDDHYAWFEVKSKVNSLGELLRQINIYRQYAYLERGRMNNKWFLVAPRIGDEFLQIIKEQGIRFIEFDPDLTVQDEYEIDGKVYLRPFTGLESYSGIDRSNS